MTEEQSPTESVSATQDAVAEQPVATAPEPAPKEPLLKRPGFLLGMVVGLGGVVLLMVCALGTMGVAAYQSITGLQSMPVQEITLSPVKAGEPWFEIADDGTGTLEGWSNGSWGESGEDGQYSFEVFEVGAVDGTPIRHVLYVKANDDTKFYMGTEAIKPKGKGSVADDIFDMESMSSAPIIDSEYRLTIEFERAGNSLVATKVTADPNGETAPYFE